MQDNRAIETDNVIVLFQSLQQVESCQIMAQFKKLGRVCGIRGLMEDVQIAEFLIKQRPQTEQRGRNSGEEKIRVWRLFLL